MVTFVCVEVFYYVVLLCVARKLTGLSVRTQIFCCVNGFFFSFGFEMWFLFFFFFFSFSFFSPRNLIFFTFQWPINMINILYKSALLSWLQVKHGLFCFRYPFGMYIVVFSRYSIKFVLGGFLGMIFFLFCSKRCFMRYTSFPWFLWKFCNVENSGLYLSGKLWLEMSKSICTAAKPVM